MKAGRVIPRSAWEWFAAAVLGPIAVVVLLEQLSLSDAWRGGLEFCAGLGAIAVMAMWVWMNRDVLTEHEWRHRQTVASRVHDVEPWVPGPRSRQRRRDRRGRSA